MKNFLLSVTIALMSTFVNAQEYLIEEKTVTGVFDVDGKSKAEIFSSISKWISINYNSSKAVVQLSDESGGNIIVKGINEAKCQNISSMLRTDVANGGYFPIKFNHLIEINIKNNKFRIIYKITDCFIDVSSYENFANLTFKCINFNSVDDSSIADFIEYHDKILKAWFIGKEKREKYKSLARPMYEELNSDLLSNMKATMKLIENSIKSTSNDGW